MDRTEAKLKFGNSLASSSIGSFISANIDAEKARSVEIKKEDKRYKKKEQTRCDLRKTGVVNESEQSNNSNRSELCTYFLSLLRSHSSENGDDLPVIEFNALKSVAFVVEAYLFHINLLDELELGVLPRTQVDETEVFNIYKNFIIINTI